MRRTPVWLVWIGILALYAAVRIPLLAVPLERDEGAFGVVGQAILHGAVPYRDVLDHKPPGVYYLYAAALLAVPPTATGIHLFLLVWNLATLLCLASLARALFGPLAARWTALLFAVVSTAPSVQGFSATTEMLLLLPLVASWRLAVAAGRLVGATRLLAFALSGVLGAAACWLKQPAALPLLVVPIFIVTEGGVAHLARAAADLAIWLAAGVALSALIVLGFWWAGALPDFWYWTVEHNRLYAAEPVTEWALRLRLQGGKLLWDAGVPLAVGILCSAVALARRRHQASLALPFLILSALAVAHSWYFYSHYFALLAPATALIGGIGFAETQDTASRALPRWAHALFVPAALALIALPPLHARPEYWWRPNPTDVALRAFGPQGFESAELIARYLRDHTTARDRVFIYGSEAEIAFLAERPLATSFVTVYPLTRPWPRNREFQHRAWSELERDPPAYVLIARVPTSLTRAPTIDPFFEQRLTALAQRAYRGDSLLVYDPASGGRLATTFPAAGSSEVVQFELWRRSDLFESADQH